MNLFKQLTGWRTRCSLACAAAFVIAFLSAGACNADDYGYDEGWPSWHRLWYKQDGTSRFKRGFTSATNHRKTRIPAYPPICSPSFGYYQPCWRQLPVERRCSVCEMISQSPGGPVPTTGAGGDTNMGTPTEVPPAPVTPAAPEEAPYSEETTSRAKAPRKYRSDSAKSDIVPTKYTVER